MNAIKKITLGVLVLSSSILFAQNKKDSLGLPGDNFDLYGALELFKKSESPEAFEKAINSNDNEINNLDLDADGKVDYVKVVDKGEGEARLLVLQVAVSKTELQDVAVIEIEKSAKDKAHMQIVGDEELYGKDYIIEPKETAAASSERSAPKNENNGQVDDLYNSGSNVTDNTNRYNTADDNSAYTSGGSPVVVNVYAWPAVRYVYTPAYVAWVSPWYWGYYPGWWQPWSPIYYGVYYRRMYHYHQPYYHRVNYYSCRTAHNYYYGRRSASETVRGHQHSGVYRDRQASYRNNVTPGRRYNNQPANPRQQVVREQPGRQNNTIRGGGENPRLGRQQGAGSQEQASPRQGGPQQVSPSGSITQPRQKARSQEVMPGSHTQPRQQAMPGRSNVQPRQQAQPREQAQPRQSAPRQSAQPAERSGGGVRQGGGKR